MKKAWVRIQPWDKSLAIAALESGADAVWLDRGDAPKVRELGRMTVIAEDGDLVPGRDVHPFDLATKEDEVRAVRFATDALLVLRMKNWTVIPIENLLAQRGNLLAEVATAEQARTMVGILEKGVDGVVLNTRDPAVIRQAVAQVHEVSPRLELTPATVTRVEPGGMGDRVCIDTCSMMRAGEGMLVGNTSSAFLLVHAETQENPYVAARPFRVNASAVHAYLLLPEEKTAYLSDLRTGQEVLVVDAQGRTRTAQIGRCKIEKRPMLLVAARAGEREITLHLQNAETINLTTPDGQPVSVAVLKPGDQILAYFQEGGRHFGMKIRESLKEV
jgi:3-dehydroquinate synthase II